MNEQDGTQVTTLQCPANDDIEAWTLYWKAKGQPWRTAPEIDTQRQEELAKCRSIKPDIEKGIYPFKDVKLSRKDVEWLLATHENGSGPVDYSDERQRERRGIDLRGANMTNENLSGLPLAYIHAVFNWVQVQEEQFATTEQREAAVVHLEGAILNNTHLEGADLGGVYLKGANLGEAYLEKADLCYAHLEEADLRDAHLERANLDDAQLRRANLSSAYLQEATLMETHLEGATLIEIHLEGAHLFMTHLEGAILPKAHLEKAELWEAHLERAWLTEAHLEGASLREVHLEGARLCEAFFDSATRLEKVVLGNNKIGYVSLADIHWGGLNATVVNWSALPLLGDECEAHRQKRYDGKTKNKDTRLDEYHAAVRANRQLATVLRDQGLNEEADRFAYRGQILQRVVWRWQGRYLKYTGSWLLALLAGYGYRPLRSVFWYLAIILVFALAYYTFGHLSLFPPDAFVYSLTSFHGRGFFPGLESKPSLHDPLVLLAALEAVIGLFIEISFIATFTQRFFGK